MKKSLLLLAMVLLNLLPLPANAEDTNTKPLSHIYTDCLFTYYYSYVEDTQKNYHKTFCFESRSIEDREYMAMIECDEYGDYDSGNEHCIYAYLREENQQIYMLRGNSIPEITSGWWYGSTYGRRDKETMIYDFNLLPGDTYRIGSTDDYVFLVENPTSTDVWNWMYDNAQFSPYSYLCTWDYGMLTLKNKYFDTVFGREVYTFAQKFFDPDEKFTNGLDYYNPMKWDSSGWRTFDVIDGFGCMQSLVAFPGLFPPCPNIMTMFITAENPILCKVQRKDTKEILFEKTDLPNPPLVEELDADGNAEAAYYNLQGQKVAAPEEGSIYIVKRGAKASKEVYRQ